MTVISTSVVAATVSLTNGVLGDIGATLNFAAVFDVELTAGGAVLPVPGAAGAAVKEFVPPVTTGGIGAAGQADGSQDPAAPDLPISVDAIDRDIENVVVQPPVFVLMTPVAVAPIEPAQAVPTGASSEETDSLIQPRDAGRVTPTAIRNTLVVGRPKVPIEPVKPTATEAASKTATAVDMAPIASGQLLLPVMDQIAPATEAGRPTLAIALPGNIPVERLLAALSQDSPTERQWLDTVIRDVASVAVKSGDVRFRVEPDGLGRMTVERTADRLEISVSEPRAMVIAEAARPQVVAGAATLGAPVAGATVVLDQSGQRSREDARQRQQIEHRDADDAGENHATQIGRYA